MAAIINIVQALLDVFMTRFLRGDFNQLRIAQQAFAELANAAIQCRGEQQGLACGRRGSSDHFDRLDKAHVEHAVCFVQHQQFEA